MFYFFSLATQATQGSRLRSAYCYCSIVWTAALHGLCSKAELEGNGPVESAASRAINDKHEVH